MFICEMKRLESTGLPSTPSFHNSIICFGLTFLLFKCSFIKIVINGLQHARPWAGCWGEENTPCVKMFAALCADRLITVTPCGWCWVGWAHRLSREGPPVEPGISKKASWSRWSLIRTGQERVGQEYSRTGHRHATTRQGPRAVEWDNGADWGAVRRGGQRPGSKCSCQKMFS